LVWRRWRKDGCTDALALDANYVRGRMRRFSGREAQRMVAEGEPVAGRIRVFGKADATAASEILKGSPEAAQWTAWGFRELLGWQGVWRW